jgi:hypothetical protein
VLNLSTAFQAVLNIAYMTTVVLAGILSGMKDCNNAIEDIDTLLDRSMLYKI